MFTILIEYKGILKIYVTALRAGLIRIKQYISIITTYSSVL